MVESGVGGREKMGRGVPADSVLVSCIYGSDPLVLVGSQVNNQVINLYINVKVPRKQSMLMLPEKWV